tara:strand:- start:171 stop:530 length:360 start_codon:yes stop_codon:yes gene_type:complete
MTTYHEFDESQVNEAIESARNHFAENDVAKMNATSDISGHTHMLLSGGCIKVTVENGKVCLSLPLGIGKVCLPIPSSIPNGTAAQACLHICTTFGIPTGIKVTVSVAGITIVQQSFGKC